MEDHNKTIEIKIDEDSGMDYRTEYYGLIPVGVILVIVFVRVSFVLCKSYGQKTRTPAQRRMYAGSRARQSLSQVEPTIYVSPANLPPPPKYGLCPRRNPLDSGLGSGFSDPTRRVLRATDAGVLPLHCALCEKACRRMRVYYNQCNGKRPHRPSQSGQRTSGLRYVSPANLPPPIKYECLAPPSYEEVVGIHYPQYQVQPITQPITAAMAQGSSNVNVNVTNDVPSTVITVTSERRTSVHVASS